MKKYIYISLFTFAMAFTACSSLDESNIADAVSVDGQNIRMHATIKGGTRMDVPSDLKTDWADGDVIFMFIDGGDADKGFKATYNSGKWNFAEWYKNGGKQDFKPEGGTISFAMTGENLNLASKKPSDFGLAKTALQTLTSLVTGGKIGDIMFSNAGTYTVDENGVVDIYLQLERPMAKIHIKGAYVGAPQIRNHVEGTKPTGNDNAAGTNANYNKAKTMTLNQIIRFQPSSQTFRDAMIANNMNGTSNYVSEKRSDDVQIMDAVYYGTLDADENGDITIVMCVDARTYPGIQANAALGGAGQVAYWRKFPGKSINPGDNIYIYGPMSDEEATLWTSQAITGEMNFTQTTMTLAENQSINLKPYCKWKTPAPSNRTLTFEVGNPSVVTISEDGNTLYTHGTGSSTVKATTADGNESTMTVYVKEVQELVDPKLSTWGSSYNTTGNVGWEFFNNTVVDLTVTKVAMLVPDGTGGYTEEVTVDGLSLLARASNGTASGTLKLKDVTKDAAKLPTSKLRITYTYNGSSYSIDVQFTDPSQPK